MPVYRFLQAIHLTLFVVWLVGFFGWLRQPAAPVDNLPAWQPDPWQVPARHEICREWVPWRGLRLMRYRDRDFNGAWAEVGSGLGRHVLSAQTYGDDWYAVAYCWQHGLYSFQSGPTTAVVWERDRLIVQWGLPVRQWEVWPTVKEVYREPG